MKAIVTVAGPAMKPLHNTRAMTDVLLEFIQEYVAKYGTSSPKRAKR